MQNTAIRLHNSLIPSEYEPIISANQLNLQAPLSPNAEKVVWTGRHEISQIFTGKDKRKIVMIGPCGVRLDTQDGRYSFDEFAEGISKIAYEVQDTLLVVMRANFEKPRTDIGYFGAAINGPYHKYIHGEQQSINDNLLELYKLYGDILHKYQIPLVSEILSLNIGTSLSPVLSAGWIGANNATSQNNRELMNALQIPTGVKHTKDGNLMSAINAMKTISTLTGNSSLGNGVELLGNNIVQLILRGADAKEVVNCSSEEIQKALILLKKQGFLPQVMVDCNHGNSNKQPEKQFDIASHALHVDGVSGVIIEADLYHGRTNDASYGRSATDPCISLEEAQDGIIKLHRELS